MPTTPSDLDDRKHEDFRQGAKMVFDLLKHATTLSTGTVLLLITVTHNIARSPSTFWFRTSIVLLLLSVFLALACMLMISVGVKKGGEPSRTESGFWVAGIFGVILTFVAGLASSTIYLVGHHP